MLQVCNIEGKNVLTSTNVLAQQRLQNSLCVSGNSFAGLYAGPVIQHSGAWYGYECSEKFAQHIQSQSTATQTVLQCCGINPNTGLDTVVDTTGYFAAVQRLCGAVTMLVASRILMAPKISPRQFCA